MREKTLVAPPRAKKGSHSEINLNIRDRGGVAETTLRGPWDGKLCSGVNNKTESWHKEGGKQKEKRKKKNGGGEYPVNCGWMVAR